MTMFVGVLRLRLELPESSSLKDKRQVTRSILARLRNEYRVAAAEVGDLDSWTFAELGVSCVANDARHVDAVLAKAVSFVERYWPEYPLVDVESEVNPAF
jgi:uncharacterized protein